jgi:hypothetical protein
VTCEPPLGISQLSLGYSIGEKGVEMGVTLVKLNSSSHEGMGQWDGLLDPLERKIIVSYDHRIVEEDQEKRDSYI